MLIRFPILILILLPALVPGAFRVWGEEEPIRYRVRIAGIDDRGLRRELENVSVMEGLSDRPPLSELQLRRRARRDPPLFEQVLRNHGYYQPKVETIMDLDRRRPRVRFELEPGPAYRLRNVTIDALDASVLMPLGEEIGLKTGEVALASKILAGNDEIVRILRTRGHAFARVSSREVFVVHRAEAVDVHFVVEPGETYRFGETTFEGLETVREPFLRNKLPWEPGDPFDGRNLALARRRLVGADLFGSVRLLTGEVPAEGDDLLPVTVELSERRHRSVTLGVGYGTDEGWRTRAGWQHRNLLQRGERLSFDYAVSEVGQGGELAFKIPDFRRVDQDLHLALQQEVEDTQAFRSEKFGALARVERLTGDERVYGLGVGMRYSSVRDAEDTQAYNLVYIPVTMEQDRSDDPLDPRGGTRLSLGVAPYWDTLDTEIFFIKPRFSFAGYFTLNERYEVDWAGRVTVASILGEARKEIPADERYYAGGGGSIRGYSFQSVGPIEDGNFTGGRSLFLISQEIRWRWSETMGLVGFVDGGAVTEEALFDPTVDDFRWGTGLGFRYYTPVGPLRFDVAFPINRREGIDDPWQFYISLGQAF